MKFSSISLITAGLAAIAGSTIAAPGPLYARALLVDDNLFRRNDDWQAHHRTVAGASIKASRYHHKASIEATKSHDTYRAAEADKYLAAEALVHLHDAQQTKPHDAAAEALVHLHDAQQTKPHDTDQALVRLHDARQTKSAWWQEKAGIHDAISTYYAAATVVHLHDAQQPQKGPRYPTIESHYQAALLGQQTGKQGSR